MTCKVSFKHPHFPDDYEFSVYGIGAMKNDGVPIEVNEEEFKSKTGMSLEDAFSKNAFVTVEGTSKSSVIPGVTAPADEGSEQNG